jgi:3-oxoacyl-[acyl-carrier protein] reductase
MTSSEREFRLDGKVALVTGGGTGIGRAIAETFVAAGAQVVIAGRRESTLKEAMKSLGGAEHALAAAGDVTDGADRRRFVQTAVDTFGGLDILVNNAGAVGTGPLGILDEELWSRLLAVNVTAPLLLTREALPHLRERRGVVLNVSTGAALQPVAGFGAYGATKAALNHASKVLALEAAPEVRVNILSPGGVDTDIFETFVPKEDVPGIKERYATMAPLGRIGRPRDIASAALFLCSDAGGFVTGANLCVDGGLNLA